MRLDRVLAILGLAVAAGICLIWIEGYNLRLSQKVTELYHERQLLAGEHARLRLAVSRLAAPAEILKRLKQATTPPAEPQPPSAGEPPNIPLASMPQ